MVVKIEPSNVIARIVSIMVSSNELYEVFGAALDSYIEDLIVVIVSFIIGVYYF
jgi:hypothetical protein